MDKLWRLAKARSKKAFERDCEPVLAEYERVTRDGVEWLREPKMAVDYAQVLEKWMKKKDAAEASKAARSQFILPSSPGISKQVAAPTN